jgi:hypothetical protein
MSQSQKTYRTILVYFSFLLGWLLIFCAGAVLIGPDWEHGTFIKVTTLLTMSSVGILGFILTLGKLKNGTPWGYCVWFYSCWMIGIYTFTEKSSPKALSSVADLFSALFGLLFVWAILGMLPYVFVKFFSWLQQFISTGNNPFESQHSIANTVAHSTCSACHTTNQSNASFCSNCGTSLSKEIRCNHCNAIRQQGQKFCQECGKPAS